MQSASPEVSLDLTETVLQSVLVAAHPPIRLESYGMMRLAS